MSDGLRYEHLVGADFVESVFASPDARKTLKSCRVARLDAFIPALYTSAILTQTIDQNRRLFAPMFFED
jgi:hypothetical protein